MQTKLYVSSHDFCIEPRKLSIFSRKFSHADSSFIYPRSLAFTFWLWIVRAAWRRMVLLVAGCMAQDVLIYQWEVWLWLVALPIFISTIFDSYLIPCAPCLLESFEQRNRRRFRYAKRRFHATSQFFSFRASTRMLVSWILRDREIRLITIR